MSKTPPPPEDSLIDWLREKARAPFETPRGDVGDQVPLQWLPDLALQDSRVGFAVQQLLREGDAGVTDRLLHVSTNSAMRRAVAAALGDSATTLASIEAAGGFTMLGRAVHALQILRDAGPLPDATLTVLHDIDRRGNGWPSSLAIGLAASPERFIEQLVPALPRLTAEETHELAWVLIGNASEDTLTLIFAHVGAQASTTERANLADAVKHDLDAQAQAHRQLLDLGIALPAVEPVTTRWARYAELLRVSS
jgi:hypothetical protein